MFVYFMWWIFLNLKFNKKKPWSNKKWKIKETTFEMLLRCFENLVISTRIISKSGQILTKN